MANQNANAEVLRNWSPPVNDSPLSLQQTGVSRGVADPLFHQLSCQLLEILLFHLPGLSDFYGIFITPRGELKGRTEERLVRVHSVTSLLLLLLSWDGHSLVWSD